MNHSEIIAIVEKVKADNLSIAQNMVVDGQVVISKGQMLESIKPLDKILDHLSSLNA